MRENMNMNPPIWIVFRPNPISSDDNADNRPIIGVYSSLNGANEYARSAISEFVMRSMQDGTGPGDVNPTYLMMLESLAVGHFGAAIDYFAELTGDKIHVIKGDLKP
jgi:hypothetical protein